MGVSPSCLEYDLSRLDPRVVERFAPLFRSIPCVRTASAGMPLGELDLSLMGAQPGGVVAPAFIGGPFYEDESAYQLVRRLFIGATAPCFLVDEGEEPLDARTMLGEEWAPQEFAQPRSNAAVRVS